MRNGACVDIDPLICFFRSAERAPSSLIQKFISFTTSISGRRSLKTEVRERLLGVIVYVVRVLKGGNHFHFKFPYLKI